MSVSGVSSEYIWLTDDMGAEEDLSFRDSGVYVSESFFKAFISHPWNKDGWSSLCCVTFLILSEFTGFIIHLFYSSH